MDIEEILGFQPDLIFFVALALGTPLIQYVLQTPACIHETDVSILLLVVYIIALPRLT